MGKPAKGLTDLLQAMYRTRCPDARPAVMKFLVASIKYCAPDTPRDAVHAPHPG